MKFIATCLLFGLALLLGAGSPTALAGAEDVRVTPATLNFGAVPNHQSKTMSFRLEVKKIGDYTVTVTAPFVLISKPSGHFGVLEAIGTAADNIAVTLPLNLPLGPVSGTATVKFRPRFPLGGPAEITRTVALTATVAASTITPPPPTGFDLATRLEHDSASIVGGVRRVGLNVFAKVQGGATAPFKTRMLVSVDGGPEVEVFNQPIVYAGGNGQMFTLGHDIPPSAQRITFRVISDPDNAAVEINENNNTQTITRTFN